MFNGGPNEAKPGFILPDGVGLGDAPRNFVRGFDATQVNLPARRQFHVHDRHGGIRHIELEDAAIAALLQAHAQGNGSEYVFLNRYGRKLVETTGVV
jgi:hypothetical protein